VSIHIDDRLDSGNIEVLAANDPSDIQLRIRKDPPTDTPKGVTEFFQWFHFRVAGQRGVPLTIRIMNAGQAAFPNAWTGYRAVASTDREDWVRVDTDYSDGVLTISHTPAGDAVWFAYFAPFDLGRHAALLGWCAESPHARLAPLGETLDGRPLDRLVIGGGPRSAWVIARQHPGESMASWWMEGFLGRLLDPDDALAAKLRSLATVHVVPNMNPDGSFRGHLRTNASGANLNREWAEPSAERSPEVLHTRNAMDETGVDLCLDVHGDEALPYNFIAGSEGIEGWTPERAAALQRFKQDYERANPDFQRAHGYPAPGAGRANLTMCTNQTAHRYGCLAMTLEMPFKDNADRPDPVAGWSPERCRQLGASALDPMLGALEG
jgi:murein tripeptide amidase MpaA